MFSLYDSSSVRCSNPRGDHLQQSIDPHSASRVMLSFAFPCSLATAPAQRAHSCFVPMTRALGAPLPAGLRSLGPQIGVVLQPSHLAAVGASDLRGFAAGRFQYCGPGPANTAAAKKPLTIIPTELRIRLRVVFMDFDLFNNH